MFECAENHKHAASLKHYVFLAEICQTPRMCPHSEILGVRHEISGMNTNDILFASERVFTVLRGRDRGSRTYKTHPFGYVLYVQRKIMTATRSKNSLSNVFWVFKRVSGADEYPNIKNTPWGHVIGFIVVWASCSPSSYCMRNRNRMKRRI